MMLVKDIETAWLSAPMEKWQYPAPLDRSALVHLCRRLDANKESTCILELGGGHSTLLWHAMNELGMLKAEVYTITHQPAQAAQLKQLVDASAFIHIHTASLKQLTDEEWESVFREPAKAAEKWPELGNIVSEDQYWHYTIRNTFYGNEALLPVPKQSIDVFIVDGPHGNGRSLAYPLLIPYCKPDAYVLVDDFDHYPFLADLRRVTNYRELYREIIGDKRWVLLQLEAQQEEVSAE